MFIANPDFPGDNLIINFISITINVLDLLIVFRLCSFT